MGADYRRSFHTICMYSTRAAWLPQNATEHAHLQGAGATAAAIAGMEMLICEPVVARALFVDTQVPAGAGESWIITLMVNGAPTALTVTIGGAAQTQGNDLLNQVALVPYDRVAWRIVGSAAVGGGHGRISCLLRE